MFIYLKVHGSLHVLKFIACIHILHTPICIYNLSMSKINVAEQSFRCFVRKKKVENSQIYFIFTEKSSLDSVSMFQKCVICNKDLHEKQKYTDNSHRAFIFT